MKKWSITAPGFTRAVLKWQAWPPGVYLPPFPLHPIASDEATRGALAAYGQAPNLFYVPEELARALFVVEEKP